MPRPGRRCRRRRLPCAVSVPRGRQFARTATRTSRRCCARSARSAATPSAMPLASATNPLSRPHARHERTDRCAARAGDRAVQRRERVGAPTSASTCPPRSTRRLVMCPVASSACAAARARLGVAAFDGLAQRDRAGDEAQCRSGAFARDALAVDALGDARRARRSTVVEQASETTCAEGRCGAARALRPPCTAEPQPASSGEDRAGDSARVRRRGLAHARNHRARILSGC